MEYITAKQLTDKIKSLTKFNPNAFVAVNISGSLYLISDVGIIENSHPEPILLLDRKLAKFNINEITS